VAAAASVGSEIVAAPSVRAVGSGGGSVGTGGGGGDRGGQDGADVDGSGPSDEGGGVCEATGAGAIARLPFAAGVRGAAGEGLPPQPSTPQPSTKRSTLRTRATTHRHCMGGWVLARGPISG
jgi:hypothetical protein